MPLAAFLPDLTPLSWTLVVVGALIVGVSKTALPGSSTIAVGLFAMAMPAKESTAALLLLLIVGDAMALWIYRRDPDWRMLLRLLPSVLAGLVAGTVFFATVGGDIVRATIGAILLVLVAVTVWRRRPQRAAAPALDDADDRRPAANRLTSAFFGLLGGFTTMVANAGGPVMSLFFLAMRLPVRAFLGTTAVFFAVVNILKLPFSTGLGLITRETLAMDALLIPAVLLGAFIGARLARRIPQKAFENVVLVLTVGSALGLLVL